jgi:hypothetical protein
MNCERCGKNLALVGRSHNCVANTMANTRKRVANNGDVAQLEERLPCKQDVGGSTPLVSTNTYRYRDADKRKTYMRDYMRRQRAEKKIHVV